MEKCLAVYDKNTIFAPYYNPIYMLERKFTRYLERFLNEEPNKILLVNGARQIGKSYLVRYVGKRLFKHFVEINLKEDKEGVCQCEDHQRPIYAAW